MKKINQILSVILCSAFILCVSSVECQAQYVTLRGKQFIDEHGVPFFPMAMNYRAQIVHDTLPNPAFKMVRSPSYGTTWKLEGGYKWSNCETSLDEDFAKLRQMKFNAIRLLMYINKKKDAMGFSITSSHFGDLKGQFTFDLVPDKDADINYSNNPDEQKLFSLIAHFLDIAQNNNIKVILLCEGGTLGTPDIGSSQADADDYALFLAALASHLKDKPALLAYDLYNEPNFGVTAHKLVTDKYTISKFVSQWYDAVKAADPNHLITLGGTTAGDVMAWDNAVMKLDFVSMHIYPKVNDFEKYDPVIATERVVNMIYWCSNAIQRPWIIGETGFSTSPDSCINSVPEASDGSYADLYNYIAAVLPAMRDCGGSGFSWFEFQDEHFYCIPSSMCSSCTHCRICPPGPQTSIKRVHDEYFGLLQFEDPVNGVYPSTADKKGVAYTANIFDPAASAPCKAPTANYFNPHNYPPSRSTVSGIVIDDSTKAVIKNAYIFSHTTIHHSTDPTKGKESRNEYTFSDSTGHFSLIPAPDDSLPTTVDDIHIGACGSEKIVRYPPIKENQTFKLKRAIVYKKSE